MPLPTGTCKQLAGGADLVAFLDLGVVAQDDGADLGFLEVQRQADDAFAEIEHLVEHRVGQAFDLGPRRRRSRGRRRRSAGRWWS